MALSSSPGQSSQASVPLNCITSFCPMTRSLWA